LVFNVLFPILETGHKLCPVDIPFWNINNMVSIPPRRFAVAQKLHVHLVLGCQFGILRFWGLLFLSKEEYRIFSFDFQILRVLRRGIKNRRAEQSKQSRSVQLLKFSRHPPSRAPLSIANKKNHRFVNCTMLIFWFEKSVRF
jgi:hypothetical protein